MAQEDEAAALRAHYLEKLTSVLPHHSMSAEDVGKVFELVDGLCEAIARVDSPLIREVAITASQAAFFSGAGTDARVQPAVKVFNSYLRERVEFIHANRQSVCTEDAPSTPLQTNTTPNESPISCESKELTELRERFLQRIMEVDPPGPCRQREDALAYLVGLDRTCDSIFVNPAPHMREAMLRGAVAAFHSVIHFDSRLESFIDLLTSYMRERITLRLQSESPFSETADHFVVKALIIPGDRTKEGVLVRGVSGLWFEIVRRIKDDPGMIHRIDCWKWEELLAGAYKQDGWEIVTLTPKRSDKGVDVIAERRDWGQLRFLLLDQMKAYKPGHLIGPDEIREMKGVLLDHPEASKALITTTAAFTSGALEAAEILAPRLELRPRDKLVAWLASIATEKLKG